MRAYEAMFVLRPDLNEAERTQHFDQLKDTLQKFNAKIKSANIWAEKRLLYFNLRLKGNPTKFKEGLYYLIEFESEPAAIEKVSALYRLNEKIMRFLISLPGEK